MTRFYECGELNSTDGRGFNPPEFIRIKSGVFRGDFSVPPKLVKEGKLNFPIEIKEVTGNFICIDIKLTSLEGCPEKVGGHFVCQFNARQFTEEEVRAICNVKGKVFV